MNKAFTLFLISAAAGTLIGVAYVAFKANAAQGISNAAAAGVTNTVTGGAIGAQSSFGTILSSNPQTSLLGAVYSEFFN